MNNIFILFFKIKATFQIPVLVFKLLPHGACQVELFQHTIMEKSILVLGRHFRSCDAKREGGGVY